MPENLPAAVSAIAQMGAALGRFGALAALVLGAAGCGGSDDLAAVVAPRTPTAFAWIDPDVSLAWGAGYFGQGAHITVVDDFSSSVTYLGDLENIPEQKLHGEWVLQQAGMIASGSDLAQLDFNSGVPVTLKSGALNVINLSYGVMVPAGTSSVAWDAQDTSILAHANGAAVVVKSAGNDGVAIGSANAAGNVDFLNRDLIGKSSAIFVGALNDYGSAVAPTSLASYSNFAGPNSQVQNQFLVVGVTDNVTNLAGTSFAAPLISGYAAILASKFTTSTPTQIANQLLATARTDTVVGYNPALHGRGEASLSRALAPAAIY